MDINNFRKKMFLNSQYFTHYVEGGNTILRGIIKNNGYLYHGVLSDAKLEQINKVYRRLNACFNGIVAIELILYIYFVIFPFFVDLMKYSTAAFIILLSLIPVIFLYLTYILVNYLYENYLRKHFGEFRKTRFKPEYKNLDETEYNNYLKTEKKSVYVMLLIAFIFCAYVCTPMIINSLINLGKYKGASKLASAYLTFVPVNADVYASRGYAKYMLKQYKQAASDYENANKYTLSDSFFNDILGVKINYLSYDEMIKEFDKAISAQKDKLIKGRLLYEKANYEFQNGQYSAALTSYNKLLSSYKRGMRVHYLPEIAYYNRAKAKYVSGDKKGAAQDYAVAQKMCPGCSFEYKTTLIPRR